MGELLRCLLNVTEFSSLAPPPILPILTHLKRVYPNLAF